MLPRTKPEYRQAIDMAMGVLPRPLYQHQRKVYLMALRAGYRAGFTRVQMTYAREFLCAIRRMRVPKDIR
jgi:hypothetical protein